MKLQLRKEMKINIIKLHLYRALKVPFLRSQFSLSSVCFSSIASSAWQLKKRARSALIFLQWNTENLVGAKWQHGNCLSEIEERENVAVVVGSQAAVSKHWRRCFCSPNNIYTHQMVLLGSYSRPRWKSEKMLDASWIRNVLIFSIPFPHFRLIARVCLWRMASRWVHSNSHTRSN